MINLDIDKTVDQNNLFLLLTCYFYLKQNNYHVTAETLFKESSLSQIFEIPNEQNPLMDPDEVKNDYIKFFYYNTFIKKSSNELGSLANEFLGTFWSSFWEIFVNKIKQNNHGKTKMDCLLETASLKLTYDSETLHK